MFSCGENSIIPAGNAQPYLIIDEPNLIIDERNRVLDEPKQFLPE
jgi:hypothetical protein